MKLMVISLLIIFLTPIVVSLNFTLNSPEKVQQNQEFTVSIQSDTAETNDIKIYVEDPSASPKTISEIQNIDEWQNSYFYLKQIFPQQTEFKLKVKKQGDWQICARLRAKSPSQPVCNTISVIQSENVGGQEEAEKVEKTKKEDKQKNKDQEVKTTQVQPSNQVPVQTSNYEKISQPVKTEKILLNPPNNSTALTYTSKKERTIQWVSLSFTGLTIIIVILLALRKL